ncbi:MAG: hypothetical protein LBK95_18390 [Bifidobacteriaceae bacterium]|jgi:hypothetical protein|nr:hypothetical protein [Bifidobacteriaceae bacterium]
MGSLELPEDLTTAFSARVDAAQTAEAAGLLDGLKRRADGWEPAARYARQLAVTMPTFAQVGLTMKDYILARDLVDREYGPDGFTLRSGLLRECPYSGVEVRFAPAGPEDRSAIHIDHIVSVSDAWDSGGHRWSPKGRNWQRFCND